MTRDKQANALLKQAEENVAELSDLLNRKHIRRFLRIYAFFVELRYSSWAEKWGLFKRAILKLLGKVQIVHVKADCAIWTRIAMCLQTAQACILALREEDRNKSIYPPVSPEKVKIDEATIFTLINNAKKEKKRIVCVMTTIFTEERLKGGYFRRIKAIDDMMGKDTLKIYMSPDFWNPQEREWAPVIHAIDKEHVRVSYRPENENDCVFVRKIADVADIVYHHGVGYMDEEIIRKRHLLKIVDLHGLLPEEFAMSNNYRMVQRENLHEELAMRYADYIICVTESLRDYMKNKYPQYEQNYIILPILDQDVYKNYGKAVNGVQNAKTKPVVVYAGGMQKWQMVPEMQKCMRSQPDLTYHIFTAETEEFWKMWKETGDSHRLKGLRVEGVQSEQLWSEYERCQYGFVLREDCAVNQVACPTKLIEYITMGIVPIMITDHLGDFGIKGVKYLSVEKFCQGKFPDEATRMQIAEDNKKIIEEIMTQHELGKEYLCQVMEEQRHG